MSGIVDRSTWPASQRSGWPLSLVLALAACLLAPRPGWANPSPAESVQRGPGVVRFTSLLTATVAEPTTLLSAGLGGLFAMVLVGRRTESTHTTRV